MSEKMTQKSCTSFVEVLASKEPVPGGGGAAALVGAIGVALGNMVGSLTMGKKKYASVQAEILDLKEQSDNLQIKLLTMVEQDAEVFEPLSNAYGLPTETEEQREEKTRIMEKVLKEASAAPIEIMELCLDALTIIERFSQIGSKLAISDAGCAAACCRAALNAASLNVFINTKSMKDRTFAEQLNSRTEAMFRDGSEKADRIFRAVRDQLKQEKEMKPVILLKGAEAAKALTEQLVTRTTNLREKGITPCLAIVRVGERADDISYERGAMKRCEKVGIAVRNVHLSHDVTQEDLIREIQRLNEDAAVHGVLLFRPLPKHLDDETIRQALAPAKDMDGITDGSLSAVYAGTQGGYPPCTAAACVEMLKHYQIPMAGKHIVVIGRSLVIGKPVSMLLLAENATVTVCHSRTKFLSSICKEADILVVAAGKAGMVGADFVRPGQVVLDVGIHDDGKGGLCGDVLFDEVEPVVAAVTPVPGGVGSVTTAVLAKHVIEAAEKKLR